MPAYCPSKATEEENAAAQTTNTKKTAFVQIGSGEREKPQRLFVSQWVVMEGWRVVGKARWWGSQPTWHAFSTSPQSSVFSTNGLKQILWSCALLSNNYWYARWKIFFCFLWKSDWVDSREFQCLVSGGKASFLIHLQVSLEQKDNLMLAANVE